MVSDIFVNIPVKDLNKSVEFFTKLGFTFNAQFTSEDATSMIVGEHIYVMLLVEKYFKTFTKKELSDAHKSTEVILSFGVDSKQKVDDLLKKVRDAGGKITKEVEDSGWMYQAGFEDLDGHLWEVAYMDISKFPGQE